MKVIAEIAQAHDGSLGLLHSYIDAVKGTGADIIKFQTHIAEAESSIHEPFRVNFSYEDKTRFDYWKRMGFSIEQWRGIKDHCDEVGLEFLSSPFSMEAFELLESLNMKRHKVASGEISNYLLLEKMARSEKPLLISTGMASFNIIEETLNFVRPLNSDITLFQCTTDYPTKPENVGLNVLDEYKNRYGLPLGLSDHSGTIYPGLGAATLGADYVEVHVTFDKTMFGPDASSSLTISELTQLVEGVRFLDKVRGTGVDKSNNEKYLLLNKMFGKSLAIRRDLANGDVIGEHDLESKKPAELGIPPKEYQGILGKRVNKDIPAGSFLTREDIH